MENYVGALPAGTLLKGQAYHYSIEKVLGQGSFGITYLASVRMAGALGAIDANIRVAVKEFYMKDVNGRQGTAVTVGSKGGLYADYKRKFSREAVNLSKLKHPGIVKVIEFFEANVTAYYVMEYHSGGSLDRRIAATGGLSQTETLRLTRQITSALSFMHSKRMLHLDLKPSNIMLTADGQPVLIDFGLAKQYDANGQPENSTTIGGGTPGYSPIEQASYHDGKGFPVTMDIYALGATMFKMLTGHTPPVASDILNDGFPYNELRQHGVADTLSATIAKAMAPMRSDRFQTVEELTASWDSDFKDEDVTVIDPENPMPLKPSARQKTPGPVKVIKVNGVSFNMIHVEGGTFTMGATPEQGGDAEDDEKPAHQVTLSSYYIGETVVTQALWEAVMGSNPSFLRGSDRPVENVSWDACQEFIKRLNSMTGRHFRLPTEAEWEFAARGGNKSRGYKYSGSNTLERVAWYNANSGGETHPVKEKQANELGLYDMSGNVNEWCQDWYRSYSSSSQTTSPGCVYRGGSWYDNARNCRVSYRNFDMPEISCNGIGFRLAL